MNSWWLKIWNKIKNPSTFVKIIIFIATIVIIAAALCILFVDYEGNWLAVVAYSLFGLAAIFLSYSVYLIVLIVPSMRKSIIGFMERHDFTYLLLRNFGFRTVIFAIGSFAMSIIFSVFNGYMGVMNRSIWYGALSAYYIALAFLRGGILTYHKGKIGKAKDINVIRDEYTKAKIYRSSGIILLVLNIALSSAIAQMIFSDAHFTYVGWTIFAFAAYAFYKITMSIVNLVRANKQTDLTVKAIRNINLADATVSILALQTALLATFSNESINVSLMNTFTGIAVSVISVGIGIFMIVSGVKKMKEIQKEKDNEQRSI